MANQNTQVDSCQLQETNASTKGSKGYIKHRVRCIRVNQQPLIDPSETIDAARAPMENALGKHQGCLGNQPLHLQATQSNSLQPLKLSPRKITPPTTIRLISLQHEPDYPEHLMSHSNNRLLITLPPRARLDKIQRTPTMLI